MNNLSKDQIQKLVLSVFGFIVLIYVYFSFFLGPLNKGRATADKAIRDLQTKIASSKSELMKASNLEQQATTATTRFAALKALNPEGAPIAWFPPRIKLFFANQKIEKASIRLENNGTYKEAEMAEWGRYTWQIDLPQTDFATVGKALSALDNSEPLLTVARISIKANGTDPQFQQVNLTAHSAIKKQ